MNFWLLSIAFLTGVGAQSTTTICLNYASTITFTTFHTFSQSCPCSWPQVNPTLASTTEVVVLPSGTIIPQTSATTTKSSGRASSTAKSSLSSIVSTSQTTKPSITFSSFSITTKDISMSTATSILSTRSEFSITYDTTSANTASTTTATTSSSNAVVTDEAYINTVLRHHNIHRQNHTVNPLVWSESLAETARTIAESCVYAHNVAVPNPDYDRYGQNIGAGYLSTQMGLFITEGLYNSEVNSYTYFGREPDLDTREEWGHFSQLVWKASQAVGCWTQDCSESGLANVGDRVAPYFVVCNYGPVGNVIGQFAQNVLPDTGLPTVHADYECPTAENCV